MSDEHDGDRKQIQALITGLAGLAAEVQRQRAERTRRAAQEGQERARQVSEQLEAERLAARAQWAPPVRDPRWWINATPETITAAYEAAQSWADVDPQARAAADQIRDRWLAESDRIGPAQGALNEAKADVDVELEQADRPSRSALLDRAHTRGVEAQVAVDAIDAQMLADRSTSVALSGQARRTAESSRAAAHTPAVTRNLTRHR